jgi:hypothetical protein
MRVTSLLKARSLLRVMRERDVSGAEVRVIGVAFLGVNMGGGSSGGAVGC